MKKFAPKALKKQKKSRVQNNENFNDIEEFDEIEEENYLQGVLEEKKMEDENL